jgi:hypothetical protein
VHVGKAAALIVVAVVLGVIVLRDNSSSGFATSTNVRSTLPDFTNTTLPSLSTTTTAARATERPASTVKVVAINATGTSGKAGQATAKLQQAGYNALQPGNATQAVTNSHPTALIYVVTPGYDREAQTIAGLFGLPASAVRALPTPSPSPDIKGDVNIAVLVGSGITL